MDRYFNRASSLTGLREVAVEVGGDLNQAMRKVGLSPDLLRKPEERVAFSKVCALYQHCAEAWALPDSACASRPTSISTSSVRWRWSPGWSATCAAPSPR